MIRSTSDIDRAMAFLLGRIDYERTMSIPYGRREFALDRMRHFLDRLVNPQNRLRIIHVAGTKGKGSTSAMIAAALSAAGYRTGLYTSPHLHRLEERFQIDGQPCTPEQLASLVDLIRPIVEQLDAEGGSQTPPEPGPTYFEITTALALLHFAGYSAISDLSSHSALRTPHSALNPTSFAVLEVGLGGRLDSTNVCQPLVSVITSISYDHTQLLGNTLAQIAAEKAGIIKPGIPVISGVIDDEPRRVIEQIAAERGCQLIQSGRDFKFQYHPPHALDDAQHSQRGKIDFHSSLPNRPSGRTGIELNLLGRHQAANAAVALATLDELAAQGYAIPDEAIRQGLATVRWPARIEVIGHHPTIILDSAHNVASIQSLVDTLLESFAAPRRILIFATSQDKDIRGMLALLLPHFEAVILTRFQNNPRAVPVETLGQLATEISPSTPCYLCPTPAAAWQQARQLATPKHLLYITGSFFLAAEIKSAMDNET